MRPRGGGRCWRARYRGLGWCAWPRSRLCNLRRRSALRQAAERWVCARSSSRTTPRTAGRRCGTGRSAGAGAPRSGVPALAQLALAKSTRAAGRRTGSYARCLLSGSCDLRDVRTCLSYLPFNMRQVDEGEDGRRLAAPGLMRGNGETVGLWACAALLPARLVCCVRGALAEREGRTWRMSAVGRICCSSLACCCWYRNPVAFSSMQSLLEGQAVSQRGTCVQPMHACHDKCRQSALCAPPASSLVQLLHLQVPSSTPEYNCQPRRSPLVHLPMFPYIDCHLSS